MHRCGWNALVCLALARLCMHHEHIAELVAQMLLAEALCQLVTLAVAVPAQFVPSVAQRLERSRPWQVSCRLAAAAVVQFATCPLDFATALALLTLGCGMWRIWHAWVRQLLMLNVERLDEIALGGTGPRGTTFNIRSRHDHLGGSSGAQAKPRTIAANTNAQAERTDVPGTDAMLATGGLSRTLAPTTRTTAGAMDYPEIGIASRLLRSPFESPSARLTGPRASASFGRSPRATGKVVSADGRSDGDSEGSAVHAANFVSRFGAREASAVSSQQSQPYQHGTLHLMLVMAAAQHVLRGLRRLGLGPSEEARVRAACEQFVRVCRCSGYDTGNCENGDAANVLLAQLSAVAAAKMQQQSANSVGALLQNLLRDPTVASSWRTIGQRLARQVEGVVTSQARAKLQLFSQAKQVLRPLPYGLDPTTLPRLGGILLVSLSLHKMLFRAVKQRVTRASWSIAAVKLLSRYTVLLLLLGRFGVAQLGAHLEQIEQRRKRAKEYAQAQRRRRGGDIVFSPTIQSPGTHRRGEPWQLINRVDGSSARAKTSPSAAPRTRIRRCAVAGTCGSKHGF